MLKEVTPCKASLNIFLSVYLLCPEKRAAGLYRMANCLKPGAADFRLLDQKVVSVFRNFHENEPFLRGLVKWLGFNQYAIRYQPAARFSGQSKYTLKKMFRLALHGVTSFSIKPLYSAVYLGFILSFASVLYIPYIIYAFANNVEVSVWAS